MQTFPVFGLIGGPAHLSSVPLNLWNKPDEPKFKVGDTVMISNEYIQLVGQIAYSFPAFPTSSMKREENRYAIRKPDGNLTPYYNESEFVFAENQ